MKEGKLSRFIYDGVNEKPFWISIRNKDKCAFSRREGIVGKIICGHSIRLRLFGKDII